MSRNHLNEEELYFKYEVQNAVTREKLLLSDHYLTLSRPIIADEASKKWKGIAEFWNFTTQIFAEEAKTEDKKNWLNAFNRKCELLYDTQYRGEGVDEFYRKQRCEINNYAAHIRKHIEDTLFKELNSGERSISEIEKYVALLIEDCEARFCKFKERITKYETHRDQVVVPEIKRYTLEWYNIGWMKDIITGVYTRIFSAYQIAQCEFYTHQTQIAGYSYAIELLEMIQIELGELLKQITHDFTCLNKPECRAHPILFAF